MTQIFLVFAVILIATYTVTASFHPPQTPTIKFITIPETIEVKSSTLLKCQINSFNFSSITVGRIRYWAKFRNNQSNGNKALAMYYLFPGNPDKWAQFVSLAPSGMTLQNTTNWGLESNFSTRMTLSSDIFAGDYWCGFAYKYKDANGKV